MEEYLSIKDIIRILQISRPTAYHLIASGRLNSYRVGRLVRIKVGDLQRFVEGQPKMSHQVKPNG